MLELDFQTTKNITVLHCLTHRSSERPEPILSGMVGLAIPVCFIHPAALLIVMEFITTRGGHGHPPLITVHGGSHFYRSSGAESLQYQHLNLAHNPLQ